MIYRDITDAIRPWLSQDKIIIIKGARRVGKTTILHFLRKEIEESGGQVRYIAADLDFADPAFGDPRLFILRLDEQFGGKPGTVLIDAFQTIPKAGLFLKTLYDQRKDLYRFVISGSSTLELAKNGEFLTGRKKEFILRPFHSRSSSGRDCRNSPCANSRRTISVGSKIMRRCMERRSKPLTPSI